MPTFAKAISAPHIDAGLDGLESKPSSQDLASRVKEAIAESVHRFELPDELADTTYRFATSHEAVGKADELGATRFQYLDRWGGAMQVKKVEGAWLVHDVHRRRDDRLLTRVQEDLDRDLVRAIQSRAEQRSDAGMSAGQALDQDMATADARAFRGIEHRSWREEAALTIAMNAGRAPAYAAGLDKGISAQVQELKEQHDQRAAAKEERKAAQFTAMEYDARSSAARWTPAEARNRARTDADALRNEQDATERHYKLGDVVLRTEANDAYRQSLEFDFPAVAAEVAAHGDLRRRQTVALQARLATAGATNPGLSSGEPERGGDPKPAWSGEWDLSDPEHEARPVVVQLGSLYFGGIESRHIHGDVQLAYGEKSSPELSTAVAHARDYLRESFDASAQGLPTVIPPGDLLDRNLIADRFLAKEPHPLSSVRMRLEAVGRGQVSAMVGFIASNSGALPEEHYEEFVSALSWAKTGAHVQGVVEEYDKRFGPQLDAFQARWGGPERPAIRATLRDTQHGGDVRTASQEAAAALVAGERDLFARRQGGLREKEAVDLASADIQLLGLVDASDASSRSVALSAMGSMGSRHPAYARALRGASIGVADAAKAEWEAQRAIHGMKVPPTLLLASQDGDRLTVGRRTDGAMGWILERSARPGQVESFYGDHATERMLWRRFEEPGLDPLERTAISRLRTAHDIDDEQLHRDGSPWHTELEVAVIRGESVRAKIAVLPDGTTGMRLTSWHLEEPRMTLCESIVTLESEMTALELDDRSKADVRVLAGLYGVPNYGPHDGLASDRVIVAVSPWEVFDYQPDSMMRANFEGRTAEVLHEGVITSLHGRSGIEAWTEKHDVSDRDKQRLVDLDMAAARGVEPTVSLISSSTEKEHPMSITAAPEQQQVQRDPIERLGEKMAKADWQEAVNLVKAKDGRGSLYLPKAGGEYGGNLFLVTDTHLVQRIARGTLIAHDLNAVENGRALAGEFDAGRLQLGQPMRVEYGEKTGQATVLTFSQAKRLEVKKELTEWAEKAFPNEKARASFNKHIEQFTKEMSLRDDRPQRNQPPVQPRAQNLERGR